MSKSPFFFLHEASRSAGHTASGEMSVAWLTESCFNNLSRGGRRRRILKQTHTCVAQAFVGGRPSCSAPLILTFFFVCQKMFKENTPAR